MCNVRPDIHQMSDARTALSLGIALKELAYLEEEHHKHCLRELRLCTWQKSDTQCSDGSHRHEEMLIKGIALHYPLPCLVECLMTYYQIRNEIYQQQLPGV